MTYRRSKSSAAANSDRISVDACGLRPGDADWMGETSRIPLLAGRFGSWHLRVEREECEAIHLRTRYDRLAASYERRLRRFGFERAYSELLARVRASLDADSTGWTDVVDCGCGSGALSLALTAGLGGSRQVSLFDLSQKMLAIASHRLKAQGVSATSTRGDVRHMPFPDASFDLVLAGHVLEHFADPRSALLEMSRILRPRGRLLVVVTRHSLLGLLIELKWRVRGFSAKRLNSALTCCGFWKVQTVPVPGPWWCAQFSLACLAEKAVS